MDREKLQRGLGLFLDAMRPYAVSVIQRECWQISCNFGISFWSFFCVLLVKFNYYSYFCSQ